MIAVDTSALMAVLLRQSEAVTCMAAMASEPDLLISAGTLAEAFIVATCRGLAAELTTLVETMEFQVVPIPPAAAARIGSAYSRWGKGFHAAGLNFGDCFAYDLAKEHGCRLLFTGGDFAKTDIESVF